ncbi:hypothetical protein JZ751_010920 [Albula glossodonta]|uniref:Uncharacterized protein n=1 Tax=Albula glossodonta TaxID=121402 RepID=A0A8T2NYN5_9TELE|nr:hypothetical protein JZ751_010920 [Albula glossodonta]
MTRPGQELCMIGFSFDSQTDSRMTWLISATVAEYVNDRLLKFNICSTLSTLIGLHEPRDYF